MENNQHKLNLSLEDIQSNFGLFVLVGKLTIVILQTLVQGGSWAYIESSQDSGNSQKNYQGQENAKWLGRTCINLWCISISLISFAF